MEGALWNHTNMHSNPGFPTPAQPTVLQVSVLPEPECPHLSQETLAVRVGNFMQKIHSLVPGT